MSGKRNARGSIVDRKQKFEKEGIEKQPTLIRKLARAVMLATFGLPKREEERMYREAMPVALDKWNKEQKKNQEQIEIRNILDAQEKELSVEVSQIMNDDKEKERLGQDMIDAMYKYRKFTKEKQYKEQRIQEIIERNMEKELTKTEDLEIYSSIEGSGVEKRMDKYGDKPIEVYDLKGYPFAFLQTDISFKLSEDDIDLLRKGEDIKTTHNGIKTAARLYMDPSVWNINREDISRLDSNGLNMTSNVISNSFRRSYDRSMKQRHYVPGYSICYGFEGITGCQLIDVSPSGDGRFPPRWGERTIKLRRIDDVEEAIKHTIEHNELVTKRFNENGAVKKPDYIVTENGDITEDMKKHAAYWGIPIININMEYYPDQE